MIKFALKLNQFPPVGDECLWLSDKTEVWTHTRVIHYHEESAWLEGEGVVCAYDPSRFKPI